MAERVWGGTTLDTRRQERRAKLLDAGFALLGTGGVSAVTVRGVCRQTRLSERYLYESFGDREALVTAVYDRCVEEAQQAIVAAAFRLDDPQLAARATMEAYMTYLEADPRRGRVLLQEPLVDPTLGAHRSALLPGFAALLRARFTELKDGPDDDDAMLTATAVVGSVVMLYVAHLDGTLGVGRDRVIDHAAQLLERAWSIRSGPSRT